MKKILIVDDERTARKGLYFILKSAVREVKEADSYQQAKKMIEMNEFDLIISDLHLPSAENGLELVRFIKQRYPLTPVLMITAYGSVNSAVEAMKAGADDYITKDFSQEEIIIKIERLLDTRKLWLSNIRLSERVDDLQSKYAINLVESDPLIGESQTMLDILNLIARIGRDNDSTVLITGESGTGKELVARSIHNASPVRSKNKFVVVDISSIPATLLESQLFGHEKGSFTNALQKHSGFFESASGGTVFLDEIGDFPLELQVKLLRFMQDKTFVPVGSDDYRTADVRIIAATNRDLKELVKHSQFREDLFYRLNVINIFIPPLRERKSDIPALFDYYCTKYETQKSRKLKFTPETIQAIKDYNWPGNVRQLKNFLESMYVIGPHEIVQKADLNFDNTIQPKLNDDLLTSLIKLPLKNAKQKLIEQFEALYLNHHLKTNNGNISRLADEVGESREGLSKKIKRYGIKT
ncbi:MAG TPA: sigma-54-dependent Fis family transcriptional regulator [Caldithrix sp.]|nr:sigma-54-dependent Fis family transcriptional regulator [Calditrichaceae bacterium]HEM48640.1 sigma-54-dependent Fis family transcriptional regulator [Caldithrix sp.]HES59422.1 sigma-54-dependent Fis family transcriptional regulator [Caldithrix sp.]